MSLLICDLNLLKTKKIYNLPINQDKMNITELEHFLSNSSTLIATIKKGDESIAFSCRPIFSDYKATLFYEFIRNGDLEFTTDSQVEALAYWNFYLNQV